MHSYLFDKKYCFGIFFSVRSELQAYLSQSRSCLVVQVIYRLTRIINYYKHCRYRIFLFYEKMVEAFLV